MFVHHFTTAELAATEAFVVSERPSVLLLINESAAAVVPVRTVLVIMITFCSALLACLSHLFVYVPLSHFGFHFVYLLR